MAEQKSIADSAVDTLAAVRAMGQSLDLCCPERHAVRELKQVAEAILIDALRQARGLAFVAESMTDLRQKIEAEARAKQGGAP